MGTVLLADEVTSMLAGGGTTAVIVAVAYAVRLIWQTKSDAKVKESKAEDESEASKAEDRRKDGLAFRQEMEELLKQQTDHIKEQRGWWQEEREKNKALSDEINNLQRTLARALGRIQVLEDILKSKGLLVMPFDPMSDTGVHAPLDVAPQPRQVPPPPGVS